MPPQIILSGKELPILCSLGINATLDVTVVFLGRVMALIYMPFQMGLDPEVSGALVA